MTDRFNKLKERMSTTGVDIVYSPADDAGMPEIFVAKHLQGLHDQSSHGRKGPIPAGYNNWNSHLYKLLLDSEQIDSVRGNAIQATILEAAGFNGKPQILSQKEFDAMKGETLYRGVTDKAFIEDYKNSLVQYAGEGSFGNGTYASSSKDTTAYYTMKDTPSADEKSWESRVMEMKLTPDAKVMAFDDVMQMRMWQKEISDKFITQYQRSGATLEKVQEVEYQLHNDGDWTNFAIMQGVDAITFKVPESKINETYAIILNRGKVAINGKS